MFRALFAVGLFFAMPVGGVPSVNKGNAHIEITSRPESSEGVRKAPKQNKGVQHVDKPAAVVRRAQNAAGADELLPQKLGVQVSATGEAKSAMTKARKDAGVTCTCDHPEWGTVNRNQYTCSDGSRGNCQENEVCKKHGRFDQGNWSDACRPIEYCGYVPQEGMGVYLNRGCGVGQWGEVDGDEAECERRCATCSHCVGIRAAPGSSKCYLYESVFDQPQAPHTGTYSNTFSGWVTRVNEREAACRRRLPPEPTPAPTSAPTPAPTPLFTAPTVWHDITDKHIKDFCTHAGEEQTISQTSTAQACLNAITAYASQPTHHLNYAFWRADDETCSGCSISRSTPWEYVDLPGVVGWALEACVVTAFEHWPTGITGHEAGLGDELRIWQDKKGGFPTGRIKVMNGVGNHDLAAMRNLASSVKVEGGCCKAYGYSTTDCSGSPTTTTPISSSVQYPVNGHNSLPYGVVTPAQGLASVWQCHDCTKCIKVTQEC